jgi:hypothetical protein
LSGFLVHNSANDTVQEQSIKVIDLGGSEITGEFDSSDARAVWAYWENTRQWKILRSKNRMVLIEGQPDRYPETDESIERWLAGRFGSFRGFEIVREDPQRPSKVRIFVDPLCTRPVYYLITGEGVSISDKLSTVVLNTSGSIQPDWGGLLEGAILGTLYSNKTTVAGAVWVAPGEALEFESGVLKRRWKNPLPADASFTEGEVLSHPAETLRTAIEKAIDQTWTDPEVRLLLSGGLDSRILLMLAPGKRKTLSLELYTDEARITEQVAAAAGAELDIVPAPDYQFPMKWAYLATGAMHDSRFVTHIGLVEDWRKRGIPGVTHGYFHNTMYRGWTAAPYERYPTKESILYTWMGGNAYYLDKYGCKAERLPRQFHDLLSPDGKAILERQLGELSDSLVPVVVDGYDLTFERRLMEFVSRQIYFCVMLGWYEGVDVASPVFQPPLWTWYALSRPRHRDRDWAVRELYRTLQHPAARLPDANTGQPVAHLKPNWRDLVRNQFWYPGARAAYNKLFGKPKLYHESGMHWGERFREPNTLAAVADGMSVLLDNPLFHRSRLQSVLDEFCRGDNQFTDTICAAMAVGQWQRLVTRPASLTEHVKVFGPSQPARTEVRREEASRRPMSASRESAESASTRWPN